MMLEQAEKDINDALSRGVGEFIDPDGSFRNKLIAKAKGEYPKDIVIKFGVDVTRPDIHLGHAVVLRKLRALQDLGCKILFLIGDFTTLIGDPTGKSKARPELDFALVAKNMATYLDQVDKVLLVDRDQRGQIIDSPRFSWMRNSDWFFGVTDITPEGASESALVAEIDGNKIRIPIAPNSFVSKAVVYENTRMQKTLLKHVNTYSVSFVNLLSLLRRIPYAQLIERDMFQERIKNGEPLYMHEMLYPVIQGADSNVIADAYGSCDLEIGGTDQTFNMLMGRKIMEMTGKNPQAVLSVELLIGLEGKEKMSKSLDNYIGITDTPNDMFGKIMSLPDLLLTHYFELCTFTPMEEIDSIDAQLKSGKVNPRDKKLELAKQVVEIYHGKSAAEDALQHFIETFQKRTMPKDIPEVSAKKGEILADVLFRAGIVASKSEFRRLLDEGAIRKDGEEKLSDPMQKIEATTTLRIGKHRFIKITV
jgi:tyrosyl-tRNA synthetase